MTSIDSNLLDLLIKGLTELRGHEVQDKKKGRGKSNSNNNNKNIDPKDINSVKNALLMTVNETLDEIKKTRDDQDRKIEELQKSVRSQGDYVDEVHQRSLKGNLILTSPPTQGKTSIIRPMEQLNRDNISVTKHATDLINLKYGVEVPHGDIQAAHHLPNGSIIVRIWNRKQGSAWSRLTNEIKSGGKLNVHLFANFHLTRHRSSLLYHLRSLKKSGKITKLFSNENGQLSFKLNETSKKIHVTFSSTGKNDFPKTLTFEEINKLILQ